MKRKANSLNKYVIKFYDNLTLMEQLEVYANSSNEALRIALSQTEGLVSFDTIKVKINRGC